MKLKAILMVMLLLLTGVVSATQIDINSASADVIAKNLKGVGPSKAAAIVEFRKANGPFRKIEELTQIKGIGTKTINANRENIRFASDK